MRQQATVPDCSTEQVSGISFPALAGADEGHTGDQIKTALLDAADIIRTLANLPGDDNATSAGGGGRRERFAHRKFVRGSTVCHLDRQAPRVLEMPRQPIRNRFDHIERPMFGHGIRHSYSSQRSFPERRRRGPLACYCQVGSMHRLLRWKHPTARPAWRGNYTDRDCPSDAAGGAGAPRKNKS